MLKKTKVGGVLIAAVAAAVVIPLPAHAGPVGTSSFVLSYSTVGEHLNGSTASMQTVINELKSNYLRGVSRSGVTLPATVNQASCSEALPASHSSVCFTDGDDNSREWVPQGITSSYDSSGTSLLVGGSRVLVSWYDVCSSGEPEAPNQGCTSTYAESADMQRKKGTRISLLDPVSLQYRNVILVEPFYNSFGNASYKSVPVHAGGIAWYGNLLYVADTRNGFRVFDMNQFFDLQTPLNASYPTDYSDKTQMGRQSGTFYSFAYRFMLPQVGRYTQSSQWNGDDCLGSGPLRFSNVGLDRTTSPARLAVAEYCVPGQTNGRVARWNLSSNGYLASGTAVDAYSHDTESVQGVLTTGNTFYFNRSRGSSYGTVYRRTLNPSTGTFGGETTTETAIGCEDLTLDGSTNRLYSVAEYFGSRVLYGLPRP